ncbi:MAG: hypothetical protein V1876_00220 [Candidatus Peregrinibacteria bacterium]
MKTKTQTPITQGDGTGYPSGQWLYDEIMQWIEPDLCSGSIAQLDDLYPGETAEDRAARYERYTIAFMAFEDALLNYQERVQDDVILWSMEMEAYVHAVNANEESAKMQEIEKAIDDSAPAA